MIYSAPWKSLCSRLVLGLVLLAGTASLAIAGEGASSTGATPILGGYWSEFVDHWLGHLKHQNGVVLFALGLGAVSLFIITRGKWKK